MLQPATAALTTDDALIAFVHINKCGGTSVSQALKACDLPTSRFAEASGADGLHHHTLRAYAQMNPTRDVSSLLSFAIVRDPFARMVSLFYYQLSHCAGDHLRASCADLPPPSDLPSRSELRANASAMVPFFHAWIHRLDARYPVGSADARFFTGFPHRGEGPRRDASETAWLEDEAGDVPRGLVLLTLNETLDAQWRRFTSTTLPQCTGVELPHENSRENSSGSHYVSTTEHFEGDGGVAASIVEAQVARDFGPPLRFSRLAQQRERPRVEAGLWWEGRGIS